MRLLRFRLSSVLICITVVALLLGYSQVRRRHLNQSFNALSGQGCKLTYADHWLWPVVPKTASVAFREWRPEVYTVDGAELTPGTFMLMPEVVDRYKALRAELLSLGVQQVGMFKVRIDPASGAEEVIFTALESMGPEALLRSP